MALPASASGVPLTRRLPAELAGEVATTGASRDITKSFVGELELMFDARLRGDQQWKLYDRIFEDDQVKSTFQQRRMAVVSRDWNVLPGDEADPRSVAAAEALKDNLAAIGWDRVTLMMLKAGFQGYAVAELMWGKLPDGWLGWTAVRVRKARRFRFDGDRRLRLLTPSNLAGEVMPERKFWTVVTGADDDDEPYGIGLAHWLYWPTLFKRNGLKFWNLYLDKFGRPTAIGKYRPGTPKAEQEKLLQALAAIESDAAIAVPEGMMIELLEAARSGTGDFEKLVRYMDEAIAKVVLSQTMTTQDGSSLSQAQVHAGVKLEVVKADADLLSDSFNAGPARWWTNLNFGADVASPRVMRDVAEEVDTKAEVDIDEGLKRLGWELTEEAARDKYGDGYERVAAPEPTVPDPATAPADPKVAQLDDARRKREERAVALAEAPPRPLYVSRRLLNADELAAWAKKQGFKSVVPKQEMHVTIAYSKRPLNWFDVPDFWAGDATGGFTLNAGGARAVSQLGKEGAVVLQFASEQLKYRHEAIRAAGASWDYPEYLPHVTFTYEGGGVDLAKVEPFTGELRFGPEIFEPIVDDWQASLSQVSLGEDDGRDEVDGAVDQLMAVEGERIAAAMTGELVERLSFAENEEAARLILADALGLMHDAPLAQVLERAGFAMRGEAITGDPA